MNRLLRKIFILSLIFTLATYTAKSAKAGWYLSSDGILSFEGLGLILGESEVEGEEEQEQEQEEEHSEEDEEDEHQEQEQEQEREEEHKSEDKEDEQDDIEYEIESYQNGNKIKIERRGDKLTIKHEIEDDDESETEIEVEDGGIFEIEEHQKKTRVRVATGSGQYLYFMRGKSAAKTDFPLSINTETNELIVTTPAGTKVVTILPDQAVANMLAANVLDDLDKPGSDDLPEVEDYGGVEDSLELSEIDGELVYEINGTSNQKVLGLFKVKVNRRAIVSAKTGELLNTEQTFLDRLLDLVSF